MATAASLAGVQDNGLRWQARIKVDVPKDIPSIIEKFETTAKVNAFVDSTAKIIYKQLSNHLSKSRLPVNSLRSLETILEDFKDSMIDDQPADADIDADVVEIKVEDLMAFLNDLYDWADYYRVIIETPRA